MENKPKTRSQVYGDISEETGLSRKEVTAVFESLSKMIRRDLSKKGPGVFNVAGLMKITVVHKPATKARPGVNPFTGEQIMIKAKPARNVIKVRPLKSLKDMV
jgi:nucleoid DNA-binding protein